MNDHRVVIFVLLNVWSRNAPLLSEFRLWINEINEINEDCSNLGNFLLLLWSNTICKHATHSLLSFNRLIDRSLILSRHMQMMESPKNPCQLGRFLLSLFSLCLHQFHYEYHISTTIGIIIDWFYNYF